MEDVYLLYPMKHRRGSRTTYRPTSTGNILESIGVHGSGSRSSIGAVCEDGRCDSCECWRGLLSHWYCYSQTILHSPIRAEDSRKYQQGLGLGRRQTGGLKKRKRMCVVTSTESDIGNPGMPSKNPLSYPAACKRT
jgi:hypothetical protein